MGNVRSLHKLFLALLATLLLALTVSSAYAVKFEAADGTKYYFTANEDGTAVLDSVYFPKDTKYDEWSLPETLPDKNGRQYAVTDVANNFSVTDVQRLIIPDTVLLASEAGYQFLGNSVTEFSVSDQHPTLAAINGVLYRKADRTLLRYPARKEGARFEIPNYITAVAPFAFYGCFNLNIVTVPDTVLDFGHGAITGSYVSTIELSPAHPTLAVENGAVYHKQARALIAVLKETRQCVVPEGIVRVGDYAFYSHSRIQSVTLPGTVTEIGACAFESASIQELHLSEGLLSLGDRALSWCNYLTDLKLPESLTSIGQAAFQGVKLNSLVVPGHVRSIGEKAFFNSKLTSLTLSEGLESIGYEAFYGMKELTSITIPASVREIGKEALNNCVKLEEATILAPITALPGDIFRRCEQLKRVTLPATLTAIDGYAFQGCASLQSIQLPEGLKKIRSCAFSKCAALKALTIPASVEEIASSAFDGTDGLVLTVAKNSPAEALCVKYDWKYVLSGEPDPGNETDIPAWLRPSTPAPADWYCPNCGYLNHQNFCVNCGMKRPSADNAENTPTEAPAVTETPAPVNGLEALRRLFTKTTPEPTETPVPVLPPEPAVTAAPTPTPAVSGPTVISTHLELLNAMDEHAARGETEFTLQLSPELYADVRATIKNTDSWVSDARANAGIRSYSYYLRDRDHTFQLSEVEYRVAHRLLLAHRSGDTSGLTDRERQTLQEALRIVAACPESGAFARERYIHDTLCARVTYYTNDNSYEEKDQAIGALLNGQADCDGYSEAFYLLCNLADIPARFQHGDTYEKDDEHPDATHMWNLVQVNGVWRMTDVTWDDMDSANNQAYLYYNIDAARAGRTHFWNESVTPIQPGAAGDNNTFRPADIREASAATLAEVEQAIREAFIDRHADRVAILYPAGLSIDKEDSEELHKMICGTGVKRYSYKSGKQAVEIIPTEWFTDYWIVASEAEAVARVNALKDAGYRTFTLFYAGDFGKNLFANDYANCRLLEGQYGMKSVDTSYYPDSYGCTYDQVAFADNFSVCRDENELMRFVNVMGIRGIKEFSVCIPGEYGRTLFANDTNPLTDVLAKTGLKLNPSYTYFRDRQIVHIREAAYWPVIYRSSLSGLESGMRYQLRGQPTQFAIWTDGSYEWNSQNYKFLQTALSRAGVDTYRYIMKAARIELSEIQYLSNYALVDTEDELISFVRECKTKKLSTFQAFCTQELYESLSAKNFARFDKITKSILKKRDLYYNDSQYKIVIENAKYK